MHWHTGKSLLNTLGRAVEQLVGCLAKQQKSAVEVKVQQPGECQREVALSIFNEMMSKRVYSLFTAVHKATPIAPPTGCGIRPVPNRNLSVLEPVRRAYELGMSYTDI